MGIYYAKTAATGLGDGSSAANADTLDGCIGRVNADAAPGTIFVCADATYAKAGAAYTAGTQPIQYLGANSSGVLDGTRPLIECNYNAANWCLGNSSADSSTFVNLHFSGKDATNRLNVVFQQSGTIRHYAIGCKFATFGSGATTVLTAQLHTCVFCEFSDCLTNNGIDVINLLCCLIADSGPFFCQTRANVNLANIVFGCVVKNGYKGSRSGIFSDEGQYGGGFFICNTVDTAASAATSLLYGSQVGDIGRHKAIGNIFLASTDYGIEQSATGDCQLSLGNIFGTGHTTGAKNNIPSALQIGDSTSTPVFEDSAGSPPDYSPTGASDPQEGLLTQIAIPYEIYGSSVLNAGAVLGAFAAGGWGFQRRPRTHE